LAKFAHLGPASRRASRWIPPSGYSGFPSAIRGPSYPRVAAALLVFMTGS
jgi:hypothetical protein